MKKQLHVLASPLAQVSQIHTPLTGCQPGGSLPAQTVGRGSPPARQASARVPGSPVG